MKTRRFLPALLIIPLVLTNLAASPRGTTVTRLLVAPSGLSSGNCVDWAHACNFVYALFYAAFDATNDVIWVKQGTYKPTTTSDRSSSFPLLNGVSIYGGFAGTETSLSQRKWLAHPSILSGDIGTAGYAQDNSYHVVTAGSAGSSALLDGFTITGGYTVGGGGGEGGGIYSSGSPTLSNLVISGNYSGFFGGGMASLGGIPVLRNVAFVGNSAYSCGGGMYNSNSNPHLTNVTFDTNSALGGDGGGMCNDSSSPVITDATFHGNSATQEIGGTEGGAIFNNGSNPTVRNATFSGNSSKSVGGAVYGYASAGNYYNSIFWNDTSEFAWSGSVPVIKDSIIAGGCPSGASCTHVINADPKLGPLQNNGGVTKTMALGLGSAAIDAGGVNAACAAKDQRGVTRPQGGKCDIGAYEVKAAVFRSVGTYDGWVLESGENSFAGGTKDASATTIRIGDDASNRQYRGLLSFSTSSLPDAATLVLARVKVKQAAVVGTNPFKTHGTLTIDLKKPYFGAAIGLELADFQAPPTTSPAGTIGSAGISGWYWGLLNSAGRASLNKTGPTQLRLRFQIDDNNDHNADYLSVYSGNATSSYRPILLVYYNP